MKNVYVSPEVELICLAPAEDIAALGIDFDNLGLSSVSIFAATSSVMDIDVAI